MSTIVETDGGIFKYIGLNETALDSKKDDPPKHRLGVIRELESWGRSLGAIAFDLVHSSGSREEMVLIQGKETEDSAGNKTRGGELYLGLKKPGTASTDDAMHDALVVTYNQGFRFNLPVYAPNLGDGASGVTERLVSQDGRYVTVQQTDGNLVTYDTSLGQVGDPNAAIWSSFGGAVNR